MNDPWSEFLDHTEAYVNRQQAEMREFLGTNERFDCDLDTGILTFSTSGVVAVECSVLVAGTFSNSSKTWLWAWANPHLPAELTQRTAIVREYGLSQGFDSLTDAKWPAEESDCWMAAGIACYLLGAQGIYRAPDEVGAVYLLILSHKRLSNESIA